MRIPDFSFVPAPKTPRLSREILISEKLDGCWSAVEIDEAGEIFAASRNRWITPESDNYGFARWVEGNKTELLKLGTGRFAGEWWGAGVQRNYGLKEKRFSLFNASRWHRDATTGGVFELVDNNVLNRRGPACCSVVPILYRGDFSTGIIEETLARLGAFGSVAAPGFLDPEGIVIFHTAAGICFKKTLDGDAAKGAA